MFADEIHGYHVETDGRTFSCAELGLYRYGSAKALRRAIEKTIGQRSARQRRAWNEAYA